MPLLPLQSSGYAYEPINKQVGHNTFMNRLQHRRVAIFLVLIGLVGTITLLHTSRSNNNNNNNNNVGLVGTHVKPVTTKVVSFWPTWKQETSVNSSSNIEEGLPSSCSFAPHPASPAAGAALASSSLLSSDNKSQIHYIAEEDWHMPSEVRLLDSDKLFISRRRPYFRQEKGDIHKELGFSQSKVKLTEAPFVRRSLYRHLLQSFNSFAEYHTFHYWLAHGSLLGQKWGQKIMTGDTDIDVQCSLGDLHRVRQYEQQLWDDRFELVVNPHYLVRKTRNFRGLGIDRNVIDARWIDVLTGYYIDITALSALQADRPLLDVAPFVADQDKVAIKVQDKSPHRYDIDWINPTRRCKFEGMDLWCPNKMEDVLEEEYHDFNRPHFHTWRFNETIQAFNEISCHRLNEMYRFPTLDNCDQECRQVVAHDRQFHWSALVMTGDIRKVGCLLKVSYLNPLDGKNVTSEYWGRDDPENPLKLRNTPNVTYPAVLL